MMAIRIGPHNAESAMAKLFLAAKTSGKRRLVSDVRSGITEPSARKVITTFLFRTTPF
jgi:hypothetical protein